MIAERFRNEDLISKVKCPTFIVHGERDETISYSHSQILCEACAGPAILVIPHTMDHNRLRVGEEFILPLCKFLDDFEINTDNYSK